MVMIPLPGTGITGAGGMAGSALEAGRAAGRANYPGMDKHGGWEDDGSSVSGPRDAPRGDGSRSGTRGAPADGGGFTVQGRLYDPILSEPMAVNAETHGDFWEDDMEYAESVSTEGSDSRASSRAAADNKSCRGCPPEGKVAPMVRRCSRWSEVTISYQTRVCGTFYNPETKQIQEFRYCGVSFDGWKRMLCQFWEAKARYDQFFDVYGEPKGWWKGKESAIRQASRHQAVATMNNPLKILWLFMQPVNYKYFSKVFKVFSNVITKWMP